MKNTTIILKKQIKDTINNKAILIQFLLFPIMSAIMTFSIQTEGMPYDYFIKMFACMYIGMAPIVIASGIISEEKESGALRMLMYSNVKAKEYIAGIALYIVGGCFLGCVCMAVMASYSMTQMIVFLGVSLIGMLISVMIGSIIGICASSQMKAASWSIPVMIIFSFIPMIASFNETIRHIGFFFYTQQISEMIASLEPASFQSVNMLFLIVYFILSLALFIRVYKTHLIRF